MFVDLKVYSNNVTFVLHLLLKVQSCKLDDDKYMIASTQVTDTEMFAAFIAVLVFKFLSHKVLFINRKSNRKWQKIAYFLRK